MSTQFSAAGNCWCEGVHCLPRNGRKLKSGTACGRGELRTGLPRFETTPLEMSRPVSRVLSRTIIYLGLPLPTDSSHLLRTAGPAMCSPTVLLRIEFTASTCLHATGELLPHLSTIPCAEGAGSLFLLHLSEGRPWRVLPVIPALRSPDFPHAQAFALCPRSFGLLIFCCFNGC